MLSATKREGAGPAAEPTRFDPVPGTVVDGKYRVDKTLGEGGMGLVVAAVHLGLEQEVAIKFLLPEAMRNKVAVERFLREAKVAAKVRSEHVARVHDVGTLEEGGIPYIVMERLEGLDLGKLIERHGALPIDEACEIALQACEALAEVHAAGIVHRDLKPSNLFVTRKVDGSPSVKLLDFGISKLTTLGADEPGIDPALTQTATIMGSPSYMSPEQLKSTKEVDQRADVWSLGAVLYEAITGKPAFRGESLPQVCAMIASEDPALPSTRRDGIPIELERTVLRCLEKDPDARATLVELGRTLARYAPDRAKASLERIEATTGAPPEPRPRAPTYAERARQDSALHNTRMRLGEEAAASDRGERTMSSWGHDRRRGIRGGSGAILLLLVASGLVAVAVSTGRIGVMKLSNDIGGAASAVSSAAGAAVSAGASAVSAGASAVAAEASAVASSLPPMPPLPPLPVPDEPAASASGSSEADQGEPDEPNDEPVASAAPGTGGHSTGPQVPQAHSGARKVRPKPATHHGKTHKHHS